MDDAAGEIDPRRWEPEDVAILLLEARDHASARRSKEAEDRKRAGALWGIQASHGELSEARVREDRLLVRLGRMGFGRTWKR